MFAEMTSIGVARLRVREAFGEAYAATEAGRLVANSTARALRRGEVVVLRIVGGGALQGFLAGYDLTESTQYPLLKRGALPSSDLFSPT